MYFDAENSNIGSFKFDSFFYDIFHPEYLFFKKAENLFFNQEFLTETHFVLVNLYKSYSFTMPFFFSFQFIFGAYGLLFFITLFFSFFNKTNKNNGIFDTEFTFTNLSIEAEKEIFSADDAKYLIILVVIFFGSYFGFIALATNPFEGLTTFFLGLAPVLVLAILGVPVSLLFDFGLFFLVYLRGTAATSSIFFEFIYDYIGITAFFTRIVVQFVRIGLMVAVYAMMHETVSFEYVTSYFLPMASDLYDNVQNFITSNVTVTNLFVGKIPAQLAYWAYEVFHTFFVVTTQFAAFFTIAF